MGKTNRITAKINGICRKFGFEVRKFRPAAESLRRTVAPEMTDGEASLVLRYSEFTKTSQIRQWSLIKAIDYIDQRNIGGDIVECGVWRGGNMLMAKELRRNRAGGRKYWLYDTFAGMTEPASVDVSFSGQVAFEKFSELQRGEYNEWCYASIEDVRRNFAQYNLLDEELIFVKGRVEETLRDERNVPGNIAILRLDTDWYSSTLVELEVLFPRLATGGVLIIDDYGHWEGSRKAVDEYFGDMRPLLVPVDYSCRVAIKA